MAVVACAAGPGLAEVFGEAGAVVVASGPGRRASAGQLLDAARAAHALEVIVLPNDGDTVMAAEAAASAAEQEGITLHVVRSRTAVQGLAALAVFDATASRLAATPPQMSPRRRGDPPRRGRGRQQAGPHQCRPVRARRRPRRRGR